MYVRCLRFHGVPNFPDPGAGAPLVIPSDINPQAPAFRSAQRACAKLMPGAGANGSPTMGRRLQLLNLAECMRRHGVPTFPDPASSPPPPSSGNVLGGNGAYLALGTLQAQQSPAFRRAAGACGLTVR